MDNVGGQSSHAFAREIWISTVVKLSHKERNIVRNKVHESSPGLSPVSVECVKGALGHHGDYENNRTEGQEILKSEDPRHPSSNTGCERAEATHLAFLKVET